MPEQVLVRLVEGSVDEVYSDLPVEIVIMDHDPLYDHSPVVIIWNELLSPNLLSEEDRQAIARRRQEQACSVELSKEAR